MNPKRVLSVFLIYLTHKGVNTKHNEYAIAIPDFESLPTFSCEKNVKA